MGAGGENRAEVEFALPPKCAHAPNEEKRQSAMKPFPGFMQSHHPAPQAHPIRRIKSRRLRTPSVNRTVYAALILILSVSTSSAQPPDRRLIPSALDEKLFRTLFEHSLIVAEVTITAVRESPDTKPPIYSVHARVDDWFRGEEVFKRSHPQQGTLSFIVDSRSTSPKPVPENRVLVFLTTESNTGILILSSGHVGLFPFSDRLYMLLRRLQRSYQPAIQKWP